MGHEERFPPTRLSAGCGFRKETIAAMRRNGRDAPKAAVSANAIGPPATQRGDLRHFTLTAHRDPKPTFTVATQSQSPRCHRPHSRSSDEPARKSTAPALAPRPDQPVKRQPARRGLPRSIRWRSSPRRGGGRARLARGSLPCCLRAGNGHRPAASVPEIGRAHV